MRTKDGTELRGTTPAELVAELNATSRSPCATDAEFRYQMAGRASLYAGKRIRCDTDENFIADLIEVGQLSED